MANTGAFDQFHQTVAKAGIVASILLSCVVSIKPAASTEFYLSEFTPWLVKNCGPTNAKGVVYFILGWNRRPLLDDVRLAPYFLKTLSENCWDVIVVKIPQNLPNQESFDFGRRSHDLALPIVRKRLKELKAQGYRRVVLAGHSWGGWVTLLSAQDHTLAADALLLSAPSVGARVQRDGSANPRFQRNFTDYPRLVNGIKVPTILMLYAEDDEDPPGRGDVARKRFEQNKLPHLVINHPAGFKGHFAGWLPLWDYQFSQCILRFLENSKTNTCQLSALSHEDFRSILNLKQVKDFESKRITSTEPLVGKKFAAYSLGLFRGQWEYLNQTRIRRISLIGEVRADVIVRDGLHCADDFCRLLIRWSDREILAFNSVTGSLAEWWIEY